MTAAVWPLISSIDIDKDKSCVCLCVYRAQMYIWPRIYYHLSIESQPGSADYRSAFSFLFSVLCNTPIFVPLLLISSPWRFWYHTPICSCPLSSCPGCKPWWQMDQTLLLTFKQWKRKYTFFLFVFRSYAMRKDRMIKLNYKPFQIRGIISKIVKQ